jgi:uncharacterized iron-regulated membrane protein
MAGTGFAVWWPGRNREGRTRERIRLVRGAHGTVGAVVFAWMAMWAVTGAYFVFPAPFRNVVQRISAPADAVAVVSMDDESVHARPDLDRLVAHAETSLPEGASVTRISLPTVDTGTIQVVLTTGEPTPWEGDRHVSFEFDQFTGELLLRRDLAERSGGERLLPWFGRLHMGGFGGEFVRIAWTLAALGTAGLSVSGFVMWWRRAHVRRRWR